MFNRFKGDLGDKLYSYKDEDLSVDNDLYPCNSTSTRKSILNYVLTLTDAESYLQSVDKKVLQVFIINEINQKLRELVLLNKQSSLSCVYLFTDMYGAGTNTDSKIISE